MTDEPDKPGDSCREERDTAEGDRARWIAEFTADLRRMHQAAGKPSLRQMAMKVPYSHTALSDALRGRRGRLPSQDLTLALVRACRGDEQAWQARWHQEHARIAAHATSRDRGLGATEAVPSEIDARPSPRRSRRPRVLSALGVALALVIGGVVLAVHHGVDSAPPTYGLGGAQPTCEETGSYNSCEIQQRADRVPREETAQQMKEFVEKFSKDSPRQPGPWPFFVYDTIWTPADIGVYKTLAPAEMGRDAYLQVWTTPGTPGAAPTELIGSAHLGSVVWVDCYTNGYHGKVPKNDDVGGKWLRIPWPTNPPNTR